MENKKDYRFIVLAHQHFFFFWVHGMGSLATGQLATGRVNCTPSGFIGSQMP